MTQFTLILESMVGHERESAQDKDSRAARIVRDAGGGNGVFPERALEPQLEEDPDIDVAEARRREIKRLTNGSLRAIADKDTRREAWHRRP